MSEVVDALKNLSPSRRELVWALLRRHKFVGASLFPLVARGLTSGPLSHVQKRLWASGVAAGRSSAFGNLPVAFRWSGPCDRIALGEALLDVVRRHEPLRSRFVTNGGGVFQVVAEPAVEFEQRDIDSSGEDLQGEARRLVVDAAQRPFDLERGPLLRAMHLRLSPDEHVVAIVTHHLAADGWALRVLLQDLARSYEARTSRCSPNLPDVPIQYLDWSCWQRDRIDSGSLDEQLQYWQERLAGAPRELRFGTGPRLVARSHRAVRHPVALDEDSTAAVREYARARGATPYMVLLAAFQGVLARWTGERDVVVGSTVSNRTHPHLEWLVGNFGNNVFFRADLSAGPSFDRLVGWARDEVLAAQKNQDIPLETLVDRALTDERQMSVPRFQTMFILRDAPLENSLMIEGASIREMSPDVHMMPMDLDLDLTDHGKTISGFMAVAVDVLSSQDAARMAKLFVDTLAAALLDPEVDIFSLRPMREATGHEKYPAGEIEAAPDQGRYVEPASEIERRIATMWQRALGVAQVGATDDFYQLGGHSLLLTRMVARLGNELDVRIDLGSAMGEPTVRAIARLLDEARSGKQSVDSSGPRKVKRSDYRIGTAAGVVRLLGSTGHGDDR